MIFRSILILFISTQFIFAVGFREDRYIYAIDKNIKLEGNITFFKKSIKIDYIKPEKKSIIYTQNDAIRAKKLFFMILEAIHSDDSSLLGEFFNIKKDKKSILLTPLESTKDYIKKLRYKKEKNRLIFIEIFMQNSDRIKIETIH